MNHLQRTYIHRRNLHKPRPYIHWSHHNPGVNFGVGGVGHYSSKIYNQLRGGVADEGKVGVGSFQIRGQLDVDPHWLGTGWLGHANLLVTKKAVLIRTASCCLIIA